MSILIGNGYEILDFGFWIVNYELEVIYLPYPFVFQCSLFPTPNSQLLTPNS